MGPIGVQEMFAIVVLALLLFGPKKLPELARLLGKGLTEFRRAKNELKATLETHMNELDREVRASEFDSQPKQIGKAASPYSPVSYPYPYEDSAPYEAPVSQTTPATGSLVDTSSIHEEVTPSVPATPPVEGTIARLNGNRPSPVAVSVGTEEDRPA
jgi:TatA/E family protein of Tat protein translocase